MGLCFHMHAYVRLDSPKLTNARQKPSVLCGMIVSVKCGLTFPVQLPTGYAPMPPHMLPPPGAPVPGQMNGLQRPVTAPPPPPMVPGGGGIPTSGAPPMFPPPPYQGNMPSLPTSGSSDGSAPSAVASEADQ